jgi:murein DD-endopeptidase MepM/ murein hydrolase activator NlpD
MGDFKKELKEKVKHFWYELKRWVKIKNADIQKWGHEKLTIMFVPHSEKRVLTIHISNFAMLFILLTVAVIVITSIAAVSGKKSADQKLVRLERENQIKQEYIDTFINNVNLLKNRFASFRMDVSRIFSYVASQPIDNQIEYPTKEDESTNSSSSIENTIFAKPSEIDDLYRLRKELEIYKIQMQKFAEFIEKSKDFVNSVPSIWPVKDGGGHITSTFGYRRDPLLNIPKLHSGVDIAYWPGMPVVATADGVVVSAGWQGGYGKVIKIQHKYGFMSVYGHLMSIYVSEGQRVKKGQVIGAIGMSGRATGYHLHYEIRIGTEVVNPMPYLSIRLF